MGEKFPGILPKVATSTSLLGSFTCGKLTTWDRRLYFPSKGRRAEDFFARKIRRLRPGMNPRTRVLNASTLTSRPPKSLVGLSYQYKILGNARIWNTQTEGYFNGYTYIYVLCDSIFPKSQFNFKGTGYDKELGVLML